MAKIKWLFISAAVICALSGAFAFSYKPPCDGYPQYYKYLNHYYPAGTYGLDYVCVSSVGNCTWYQPDPFNPNSFAPCKTGHFEFVFLKK